MEPIDRYLTEHPALKNRERTIRASAAQIISQAAGVSLDFSQLSIQGSTLYINLKPIQKQAIHLKKKRILERLTEAHGDYAPREIR